MMAHLPKEYRIDSKKLMTGHVVFHKRHCPITGILVFFFLWVVVADLTDFTGKFSNGYMTLIAYPRTTFCGILVLVGICSIFAQ